METTQTIHQRWSPREYLGTPVSRDLLLKIFDDVRWAQSSFNEQPWRYLIADRNAGKERAALEALLLDGNAYAKAGWVLGLSFAKKTFSHNGTPNRCAPHDLGASSQLLALTAFSYGLHTRFMGGFHVDKAGVFASDDFEPVAMFVIGNIDPKVKPAERPRKKVAEFVFENKFGNPFA